MNARTTINQTGSWRCTVPVQLLVLVVLTGLATPTASQSVTSIQGVWRVVERTIPASTADRRDPFGAFFSKGTHTDLQPELMIFTASTLQSYH